VPRVKYRMEYRLEYSFCMSCAPRKVIFPSEGDICERTDFASADDSFDNCPDDCPEDSSDLTELDIEEGLVF
jgi:hypothetical protein